MVSGGLAVDAAAVAVPATIANLGAGYDCLGLAVDLGLEVHVEVRGRGSAEPAVEVDVAGEGAGTIPVDGSNRGVVALRAGLTALDVADADGLGLRLRVRNQIPVERGLGSSAAATVAGLALAEALAGRSLGPDELLRIATAIEGHPDNVAPALLGGLVASMALEDRVEAVRLEPPVGLRVVAWIPDRRLATSEMRRVLPATVPRADAVANLSRVAVAVAGIASGRAGAIGLLGGDRLHEPYRSAAYPELPAMVAAALAAGAGLACLAGSGSTIVAFIEGASGDAAQLGVAMREAASRLGLAGRLAELRPSDTGARELPATAPTAVAGQRR